MLPMFASPIDFLLIIDDGVISALLILLLAYVCLQKKSVKTRTAVSKISNGSI
jgi:hypothetical protein